MNDLKNNFIFIIYGPTAVGKSNLALRMAHLISAEIVNMDVGQFYTPLTIGVAKPNWHQSPVPHHLFDIIDEPRNITVVEYRVVLLETLKHIWNNNRIPIVVGGSSFYLKSIFFPPRAQTKGIDIDALYPADIDLWQELYSIDPTRAQQINRYDIYRIKRALEIWHETGQLPSSFVSEYSPPADFFLLHVTRDRDELTKRINVRVREMIKDGWLQEVEQLRSTDWEIFIQQKKIIGYNELIDYLNDKHTEKQLSKTIGSIQKRTRKYAKRQQTFWRTLKRELAQAIKQRGDGSIIESVSLTFADLDLYIKQLRKRLLSFIDENT